MRVTTTRFAPARIFLFGALCGGLMVFLVLEGRAVAIWKAISNPQAVNAVSFKTEVIVKK